MNDADFEARIETGASFGERGALRLEAAMYVGRNAHKFPDSGHAARHAMGKFLMLRRYAPLWRNNNAWLEPQCNIGHRTRYTGGEKRSPAQFGEGGMCGATQGCVNEV